MMDPFQNNFGLQLDPNFQSPGGGPGAVPPMPGMQQQLDPALIAAILGLSGPIGQAERAHAKAAVLRGQQAPLQAAGLGPLGIRTGEGPAGWAISIGDLAGGMASRANADKAEKAAAQEQGVADSLRRAAYKKYMESLQGGPVTQGAPLTNASPQDMGGTGLLSL